jgi:hypothetical protein
MWFIIRQTTAEYQPIYISGVPGMEEEEIERELRNLARLQAIEKAAQEVCTWTQPNDEDSNNWESSCGDMFFFDEGTPEENGIKFCPFCGHPITQKLYEPEPDEDE